MPKICLVACSLALCFFAGGTAAPASETELVRADAKPVGHVASVTGALLQLDAGGKAWKAVKAKDPVAAGTRVVALPFADIDSSNGAVQIQLRADVGRHGPLLVYESSVVINENDKADLDISWDRGVIALENRKAKGEAKVIVRFLKESWELTLKEPGARIGFELLVRHPPGIRDFVRDADKAFKSSEERIAQVYVLAVKGKAELSLGHEAYGLSAPPGPAQLAWDTLAGTAGVHRLEELPSWLQKPAAEDIARLTEISKHSGQLAGKDVGKFLADCAKSEVKAERMIGVICAGAVDDLGQLSDALAAEKHPEVRDLAVGVLRNWMGREPGQDEKLYQHLTKAKGYTAKEAKAIVQLLYGFSNADLAHPDVYQALINGLNYRKITLRELAHWHLNRLVPAGKEIAYDAGGAEEQRKAAITKWKELVPEGKLPKPPAGSS